METSNLELIITAASITGTILAAVLAAFGFLHREMRRGFERVDQRFLGVDEKFDRMEAKFDAKFDRMNAKFDGLRKVVAGLDVRVARIEGHLGIGFPAAGEQRTGDEPPERAA